MMPKDRILTETDGPFAKFNRKSLMPWDSDIATKQLSELWHIPVALVREQLEMNLKHLVKLNH
ncbi:TatD family hydrolase [Psychrobacter sp. ER1]